MRKRTSLYVPLGMVVAFALAATALAGGRVGPEHRLPAWSPDGKRIALVVFNDDSSRLLAVMNADGSGLHQLTGSGFAGAPSWSPDGRKIVFAFAARLYDETSISVINTDGEGFRQIPGALGSDPDWGPGGRRIAYAQPNGAGIAVVNPDGGERRLVASANADEDYGQPAWSPDGQRLAFTVAPASDVNADGYVGVIDRFGGKVTKLVGLYAADAEWSPDGRQIAVATTFSSQPHGDGSVYVEKLRTHNLKRLHTGFSPTWSPDNQKLAFEYGYNAGGPPHYEVFSINANGTNVQQLTQ